MPFTRSTETERRSNGIWAPDSGICNDKAETKKSCNLPSASKLYSWGQRDKEIYSSFYYYENMYLRFIFPIGLEC